MNSSNYDHVLSEAGRQYKCMGGNNIMFEHGAMPIAVDFHLHTRKDKEFDYKGSDNSFVSDFIDALSIQHINVGVITNHNKFDYGEYKALLTSARKKDIYILPGTELSIKEGANGIHTLIVFNPNDWFINGQDSINEFLDSAFLRIQNRENANTRCNGDLLTIIRQLNSFNKDYFMLFAHIEDNNGFYKECSGGLISSLAENQEFHNSILGLQKVRSRNAYANIANWTKRDFACVEGSDPKSLVDISRPGRVTYLKIGEYSFESIKYALADHKNRLYETIPTIKHSFIKSLSFTGGKFGGQTIAFSPQLNTLVGARGSGKSSIIEAIRYCLNIEADADKDYKNDLVKHIFASGGEASLVVVNEHGVEYKIKRILNEQPSVIDANGKDQSISPRAVIRQPIYFGQKDLAQSNQGYELRLLDKLVGSKIRPRETTISELETILSNNLRRLVSLAQIPDKIKELERTDRELQLKLAIFEDKGISDRLDKQTLCTKDAVKISSLYNNLHQILDAYKSFILSCDTAVISLTGYESKYNEQYFIRARAIIESVNQRIMHISNTVIALEEDIDRIDTIQQELEGSIQSLKDEFAHIKREINDDSLDLDNFDKYQKEKAENTERIIKFKNDLLGEDSIKEEVRTAIRQRNEELKSIYDEYNREITLINESQPVLYISITFKGDKNSLEVQLREAFRGTGLNDLKYKALCEEFSDVVSILEDFFLNDCGRMKGLSSQLTDRELSALSERITSNFDHLLRKRCDNLVEITYHGKKLSKQSAGQRASALILFILTQKDTDVFIVDQPEDDLDNQVVYTEFIKTLCAKKPNVQFIFATHNANIPVLGDAEKVVATEYNEKEIEVISGSIDSENAHQKIVDIMEGGYEAFRRRNSIYSSWHKQ